MDWPSIVTAFSTTVIAVLTGVIWYDGRRRDKSTNKMLYALIAATMYKAEIHGDAEKVRMAVETFHGLSEGVRIAMGDPSSTMSRSPCSHKRN